MVVVLVVPEVEVVLVVGLDLTTPPLPGVPDNPEVLGVQTSEVVEAVVPVPLLMMALVAVAVVQDGLD